MHAFLLAIRPLLLLAACILINLTISRIALLVVFHDRAVAVNAVGFVLRQGLRFDLVLIGLTLLMPMVLLPLLAVHQTVLSVWRTLLIIWVPVVVMSVLLMELATVPFAQQFDVRPNVFFLEYLSYPKELLSSLWESYRLSLIVGMAFTASVGWAVFSICQSLVQRMVPVRSSVALPAALVLILLLAMMIRSTTDHRPVNPSTVARTTDTLINDLPLNSLYTLVYAAYTLKNERAGNLVYDFMNREQPLPLFRSTATSNPAVKIIGTAIVSQFLYGWRTAVTRAKIVLIRI